MSGSPELVVVPDPSSAASVAAGRIADALRSAATARGRADWVTTGGSTAVGIYRQLCAPAIRDAIPWDRVHVWWGDDRFVPRDHPLSNVKPFDDIVLAWGPGEEGTAGGPAGVPIPIDQLHPFPTGEAIGAGHDAAWCAEVLAATLSAAGLATRDGWPVFDIVQVGIGTDGHILSVFPGSTAFGATTLALAVPAPTHIEPHVERVTMQPSIVTAARQVLAVVTGATKAGVVAEILGAPHDPVRWPAHLARRDGATWILDEAAAGQSAGL